MLIRDCVKNEIYNALNYDIFRFEDFTINIEEQVDEFLDQCIIKIMYDQYYFEITIDAEECFIVNSPGNIFFKASEKISIGDFLKFKEDRIHIWLLRIKDDMLNPLERRFIDDSIQSFKEDIKSKLEEMEDGYFTKDEGGELRERLEQLEKMILERDSQEELQAEISKMKEEIEFLKASIDTLTKKKWLKNALIKMWTWG